MKKIVGTIAAIALATSAVFADVNVGMGFSRGIFTPFAYDGKDALMDVSTSWGGAPRIGGSIAGSSEDCGVVATFCFDNAALSINDEAYIWVKPISWLTLKLGAAYDDTLRGNACFGSWDWLRVSATMFGEDFIFDRITGNTGNAAAKFFNSGDDYKTVQGAILMADPIEGLHIAAAFKGLQPQNGRKMEDVFADIQVAAGYTIDGVGQIKAQWIGLGKDAEDKTQGVIEAAFCLKAVEDMTLDIGAKFTTVKDGGINVNAYWAMPFDALKVHVGAGVAYEPKAVGDDAEIGLVVGAGIDYDLGNGLAVSADVRFAQSFCSADGYDSDSSISFGVWVNKGIANGTVGIGAQGTLRDKIRDFTPQDDFNFAVPVRVQCFF